MNPPNIFRLAQETQYVLFGVLFFGSVIYYKRQCVWGTLVWFGVIGLLKGFVNVPSELWEYFGGHWVNFIPLDTFITIVLYLDLLFVIFLVRRSGGSELSCFTPLYFMLPTFALLIFGAGTLVYIFAGVAIGSFWFTLFRDDKNFHGAWISNDPEKIGLVARTRRANVFVSLACLCIVMFIDWKGRQLQEESKTQQQNVVVPGKGPNVIKDTRGPTLPFPSPSPRPNSHTSTPAPVDATPSVVERTTPRSPSASPSAQASPSPDSSVPPSASSSDANPENQRNTLTFAAFLQPFYRSKLTPKRRSALLKQYTGTEIRWKVTFIQYKQTKKEFYLFFSRTDGRPLPKPTPISLAKLSRSNAAFVYSLESGAIIELVGELRRHSDSQVFIQVSDIH